MLPLFEEVILLLQICLSGNGTLGIPLNEINEHFENLFGYQIPYVEYGSSNLRSFLESLPQFYIIEDDDGTVRVIYHNPKEQGNKSCLMGKHEEFESKANDDWLVTKTVDEEEFAKLKAMLPLFFNHQALGDDFFVDLAETKFRYYVQSNKCGLCSCGQTINELFEKVNKAQYMAPRVVVMIGMQDILDGRDLIDVFCDYRRLIDALRSRHVNVTLVTLVRPIRVHYTHRLDKRIRTFNRAVLKFEEDFSFDGKVIDVYRVFKQNLILKQ